MIYAYTCHTATWLRLSYMPYEREERHTDGFCGDFDVVMKMD